MNAVPELSAVPQMTLRLSFYPDMEGALVRWEADVLGVRTSRVVLPFAGPDLALVLRALDALQDPYYPQAWTVGQRQAFAFNESEQGRLQSLGLWDRAGRLRPDSPRLLGRRLYRALIADPTGAQALGTVRDHAAALGKPLAISFCFPPNGVEWAAQPWELLWDDGPTPLLLSRGGSGTCTRHLDLPAALPPPRSGRGPLRILAISPRAGIPPELRQIERLARTAAWKPLLDSGKATMEEISPATRSALIRAIQGSQPPDIIHYYGHGRYANGQGALLLDAAGEREAWTGVGALATLFSGAGLVVLHACQGAMLGEAGMLSALAPALAAAGVPLVLAMQLSIRTDAAVQFGAALYRELAAGVSVQAALSAARQELFISEDDHMSWFVPTLYLRTRETGPAFLRRREGISRPLARPTGPVQSVVAQGGGTVHGLHMEGADGSLQHVRATSGGQISASHVRAVGSARQRLSATDGGEISGVDLRG